MEKRYKIKPFDQCMQMVKSLQHGIFLTSEYKSLNVIEKKLIDALIKSNGLS